jgi:hypothetical protein
MKEEGRRKKEEGKKERGKKEEKRKSIVNVKWDFNTSVYD